MHQKEKAISSCFSNVLQLNINVPKLNTDLLGTFTGEIERKGSALDCAREKCELALKETKSLMAIASEGTFGPHPSIPFVPSDYEILYFIDLERNFHLHQSLLSVKTNYCTEVTGKLSKLKEFADQVLFPSHGLIIKPNKSDSKSMIVKGIQAFEKLEEAFIQSCRHSLDGLALIQTDMRAHMNPTRMEVIKELAESFAVRLATLCPFCYTPGWGIVGNQKGLECEICGCETDMIRFEIFGCSKCDYKETKPRSDGLSLANPRWCFLCNP